MDGAAASNATSATSVMAASVSPDPPGLVTSAPVSALEGEVDPYTVQPDMSAWVGH